MAKNSEIVGVVLLMLVVSGRGGGAAFNNVLSEMQKMAGMINSMSSLSQLALSGNFLENMAPLLTALGSENSDENKNDIF